nr:hypothetical protein [uncultured Shinella sp.]
MLEDVVWLQVVRELVKVIEAIGQWQADALDPIHHYDTSPSQLSSGFLQDLPDRHTGPQFSLVTAIKPGVAHYRVDLSAFVIADGDESIVDGYDALEDFQYTMAPQSVDHVVDRGLKRNAAE